MESAIAPQLRCPRTLQRRIQDEYVPPYPAWAVHPDPKVTRVVVGFLGVQWMGETAKAAAWKAFESILDMLNQQDGPGHFDSARFVDELGYETLVATAYWNDPSAYEAWWNGPEPARWWASEDRLSEGVGLFREVISPRASGFECLFSTSDQLEGVAVCLGTRTDNEIQEHAYWGSMRDRIPRSQTDTLHSSGQLSAASNSATGRRIRIAGHENIAVIRSGQDWSETAGRERLLYLNQMEPVLRRGMAFLKDQGLEAGCYSNRYLQHIDRDGALLEKSFGLSFWHSLGDLEKWAEVHPTHVAIFGTFMNIVQELQFQLALRLYHEVSVLAADEQEYEYINCHAGTGLLRAATR
jgi:aldoxime dehydratase